VIFKEYGNAEQVLWNGDGNEEDPIFKDLEIHSKCLWDNAEPPIIISSNSFKEFYSILENFDLPSKNHGRI